MWGCGRPLLGCYIDDRLYGIRVWRLGLGCYRDEECDCHTLIVIERESKGNIGSPRAMGKKEKRLAIEGTRGWSTTSLCSLGRSRMETPGSAREEWMMMTLAYSVQVAVVNSNQQLLHRCCRLESTSTTQRQPYNRTVVQRIDLASHIVDPCPEVAPKHIRHTVLTHQKA